MIYVQMVTYIFFIKKWKIYSIGYKDNLLTYTCDECKVGYNCKRCELNVN